MQETKDEKEKMMLYDKHLAQKIIDKKAKSTLNIKLSQMFKAVSNDWIDEMDEKDDADDPNDPKKKKKKR